MKLSWLPQTRSFFARILPAMGLAIAVACGTGDIDEAAADNRLDMESDGQAAARCESIAPIQIGGIAAKRVPPDLNDDEVRLGTLEIVRVVADCILVEYLETDDHDSDDMRERLLAMPGVEAVGMPPTQPVLPVEPEDYRPGAGRAEPPSDLFTSLAAGRLSTCGIGTQGDLACWGYAHEPIPAEKFHTLSVGAVICGIAVSGEVHCWGGTSGDEMPILREAPIGHFQTVSVANWHACAVADDESLHCWGADGSYTLRDVPQGKFSQVATGWLHSCAIRKDTTVIYWGDDDFGQSAPPEDLRLNTVQAGSTYSCGLDDRQSVVCWGDKGQQLATPGSGAFTSLSLDSHSLLGCAIDESQALVCWGLDSADPLMDPPAGRFVDVAVGAHHACAIRIDSRAICWGDNAGR